MKSLVMIPSRQLYSSSIYSVYCKSFEVEKFHGFGRRIGNCETFPMKIATISLWNRLFPHKTTIQL